MAEIKTKPFKALLSGGGRTERCGWLADRYVLSSQVVPTRLHAMLSDPDAGRRGRAMATM